VRTSRPSDIERAQTASEYHLARLRYKSEPCQCLSRLPESDRHANAICEECSEPYRIASRCRNPVHVEFKGRATVPSTVIEPKPLILDLCNGNTTAPSRVVHEGLRVDVVMPPGWGRWHQRRE
jgi:hypothetical protein